MFAPPPMGPTFGGGGSFFGGAGATQGQPGMGGSFSSMQGRMGFGSQAQRPPLEEPTPAPIPEDTGNPNQGIILAAILGGSAILGIATGCLLFRKKGNSGDSDDDMDSDDSSDESSSDDSD